MLFIERIQSGLIFAAAWIQNSFFEPEKCLGKYVQFTHKGQITKSDTKPELKLGSAVWQLGLNETYTRIPDNNYPYESQQLKLPLIQAVVQVSKSRKKRGRSTPNGLNQLNYDITSEISKFQGEPHLDWLHVGLCMAYKYNIRVLPGEYSLSIIDGLCGLHCFDCEESAVFSINTKSNVEEKADLVQDDINEHLIKNSESEPEVSDLESDIFNFSISGDSDPEPDFDD